MISTRNQDFIEFLRHESVFTDTSIGHLEAVCLETGKTAEELVLDLGFAKHEELADIVSSITQFPIISDDDYIPNDATKSLLQEPYLRRLNAAPLRVSEGALHVAFADPRDNDTLKAISFHLGLDLVPYVATARTISSILDNAFHGQVPSDLQTDVSKEVERLHAQANDGPIIELVQDLLGHAIDEKASDIHIESQDGFTYVRFRINGSLIMHKRLKQSDGLAVNSRLKIMALLNISEIRRPQDGRIRTRLRGREIDFRVSTLPTQYGESIVLRVLDQTQVSLEWGQLGFDQNRIDQLTATLAKPNGIFLVSGPTGSGKTTTLYTALHNLDLKSKKAITIEDPIEYTLADINQVQVHSDIGLTFASTLRSVLRQDPDVILIGEIRDEETAEIAVRAALMGRLVLSTVHTNSAFGSLTRLVDLGIPRFLLAETLRGVLSQRLVRIFCLDCGGSGCEACAQTGFSTRRVVSEFLQIDESIKHQIASNQSFSEMEKAASNTGFESIRNNATQLVHANLTSEAEIHSTIG